MNFTNLEYFLVAAEEMNITKASHRLHISQQALSNHITKLESELGVPLFDRNKMFSLTYAGKRLVETSRSILDTKGQFLAEVRDIADNIQGELTIGITHTRGQAILPLLLPSFHKTHPGISIKIEEANANELDEDLQKGVIDLVLGFTPFDCPAASVTKLSPDHLLLVVPTKIMKAHFPVTYEEQKRIFSTRVNLATFKDDPFILLKKGDQIRSIMDYHFKQAHFNPHILLETSNIQTSFALAQMGMGITVYPEMFLRSITTLSADAMAPEAVDCFPIAGSDATDQFAIAHNKDRYLSQAAKDF
ncbi:MAG: LysR family transcriptional regulator, partial [Lachnospiraceae bacterium]|nr:LysR family transcriptional regulator [Lachnospiraceae bacterium]